MADYPAAIYAPRTMVNRPGAVYDALKTKVIYAEDWNKDRAEIVALETALGIALANVAVRAGVAGGQKLVGGSAVADVLKLQGTSGNGTLTSPAVQILCGNAGATYALTVLNNGNFGIGTTSPLAKLDIMGDNNQLRINTTGIYSSIYFQNNAANVAALYANVESTRLENRGSGFLGFSGGVVGATDMVIKNNGNVGIGITAPTAYLHLKAGTASVNTAPLKFTAGVLNTTAVIGAVEFIDDGANGHFYITMNVGSTLTRREFQFIA